jgi:hypothetical protein
MVNPPRFRLRDFQPDSRRSDPRKTVSEQANESRPIAESLAKLDSELLEVESYGDRVAFGAADFEYNPDDDFQQQILDFLKKPAYPDFIKQKVLSPGKLIDDFYESGSIFPDSEHDAKYNLRLLKLFSIINFGLRNFNKGFLEEQGIDKEFFANFALGSLNHYPQLLVGLVHENPPWLSDSLQSLLELKPDTKSKFVAATFLQDSRDSGFFDYGLYVGNLREIFGDDIKQDFKVRLVEANQIQSEMFNNLLDLYAEELDQEAWVSDDAFYQGQSANYDKLDDAIEELAVYDTYYESCLRFYAHVLFNKPESIQKSDLDMLLKAFIRDQIPLDKQQEDIMTGYLGPDDLDFNPFDQKHFESFVQILENIEQHSALGNFKSITANEIFTSCSELLDKFMEDINSSEEFIPVLLEKMQALEPHKANDKFLEIIYKALEKEDPIIFPNSAFKLMIHSILGSGDDEQKEKLTGLMLDDAQLKRVAEDGWRGNDEAYENQAPLVYAFFDIYSDMQNQSEISGSESLLASFITNPSIDINQLIVDLENTHKSLRMINEMEQEHRDDIGLIGRYDVDTFTFLDIIAKEALRIDQPSNQLTQKLKTWFTQYSDPRDADNLGSSALQFYGKYLV